MPHTLTATLAATPTAAPLTLPARRRWLATALALPALGDLGAAQAADTVPTPRPWPVGRATPALRLPRLGAADWSLAEARGQPLLLNFWASWCEPCRAEMPSLAALAARHAADGLQVLAVNYREGEARIARFDAAHPVGLPILRDADGAAARAFGVRIFPSTVAIGRDGRARYTVVGEVDWSGAQAQAWVAPLLAATLPPSRAGAAGAPRQR